MLSGSGIADVVAADDPKLFTDPVSLSYGDLNVTRGAATASLLLGLFDAGDGAGTWTIEVKPQAHPKGVSIEVPGTVSLTPGGEAAPARHRAGGGRRRGRRGLRLPAPAPGRRRPKVPYALLVTRPGLANAARDAAPVLPDGRHAQRRLPRRRVPVPGRGFGPAPSYTGPPVNEVGGGEALPHPHRRRRRQLRRGGRRLVARLAHPSVGARLAGRERRPGLRGHARERQQPHDRLPARRRRRRRRSSRARRRTTSPSTPA